MPSEPVSIVLVRLKRHRGSGKQFSGPCPSHDDRNYSLSIAEGRDGRALLHCHAGCRVADIIAGLGLTMRALHPSAPHMARR